MKNLRLLIEEQDKKTERDTYLFSQNNLIEPDKDIAKKIDSIKQKNFSYRLSFPELYTNKKLLDIAYKIYDSFVANLKSETKITQDSLEQVLPEFILNYQGVKGIKKETLEDIKSFIIAYILGYGPISIIFQIAGNGLNDIIINTKDYIDIIYEGKTEVTPFTFRTEEELRKVVDKMLAENNRKIDEAHPIISSKLNDGSRVEVQIPPIAANGGTCVTIRKFNDIPLMVENLIDSGQMDYKMAYFLLKLSKGKCNLIVSGGTSSGKTTFLNAITRFVDENEQVMVIEDTKEMQPQMPCHSVRSYEARNPNEEGKGAIPLEFLLRSALRSSPRRIIVGECRGPEIVVMLNAMNTGHPGSMTTIHADNVKEALVRIENMYLEARPSANIGFIRTQIVSAVDVILQLVRFPDGSRKVIAISEIEKRMEDNGVISLNNIFQYKRDVTDMKKVRGNFEVLSTPSRTLEQMNMYGVDMDTRIFDPSFEMTREMLIEELEKDLPSKMCGWNNDFLNIFMEKDSSFFYRWPHFQRMF